MPVKEFDHEERAEDAEKAERGIPWGKPAPRMEEEGVLPPAPPPMPTVEEEPEPPRRPRWYDRFWPKVF
jgi:hypothetical protein